ncbi:6-bladed beta-propeller [Herbaspirillum sp. HC18]|nr:6-bladed beta-propeller [Herbaspirillum sp. HC18]
MIRFMPRAFAALAAALVLAGCAGNGPIRGQFQYNVRPQDQRTAPVWPQPPDPPRYRYVGELIGEANFAGSGKAESAIGSMLKQVVGVYEENETVTLRRPQHGTVDDKGRVYVVDTGRNALVVFDPKRMGKDGSGKDDGQLLIWDGSEGTPRFEAPMAVTVVWDGDIAVSDAGPGAVRRINSKGEAVGQLGAGQLQRPTGLAFDARLGLLFVADTVANDIKVYDANGLLVNTIGSTGEGEGHLNAPTHLAFANGHLYVTDTLNSRIQIFDAQGTRVGGFGERGLYVGKLARPKGVAVGDGGIVYVIESYYGYLLAYNDQNELLLGISGTGAKDDRFFLPSGVWTDKQRRVYVADMFNGRVVVFEYLDTRD